MAVAAMASVTAGLIFLVLWVQGQQEVTEFLQQEEDVEAPECNKEVPDGLWAIVVIPSKLTVPTMLVQPQNLKA